MLPIRDDAPRYSTPYINWFLLALNILVFLFELTLIPPNREKLMFLFGTVPFNFNSIFHGNPSISPVAAVLPLFTSMFMHASWMHLIFNMWALYIFGDNIEDYLGHFRYLLFYLGTGVLASLTHIFFNPMSRLPSVGASGAIAGVMGAYFILFPAARVLTLVPLFFFFFWWLPAWVVLGFWFLGQFLSGAATAIASTTQTARGGIAFWAHIGGFVSGVALIKLFPSRPRRYRYFTR